LRAEGELMKVYDALVSPYINRQALRRFAEKQVRDLPNGSGYEVRSALMRSVGMQGEVIFDTYFANAQEALLLEDSYEAAQFFLGAIGKLAVAKQWKLRVSHDPVHPDRLDGIFLEDFRRAIVILPKRIEKPRGRVISLRRFVEITKMGSVKGKLKLAKRLKEAMREGALEALQEVKAIHFSLEALYSEAMDFEAKEFFTKRFCEELFDLKKE